VYIHKKIAYDICYMIPEQPWLPTAEEGRLSLDVFRAGGTLVIRSPLAGVRPDALDIALDGDLLTIRGDRGHERTIVEDDWFIQECYWGSFSRSIILPMDVEPDRTTASLKNGVLEIRIPLREGGKPLTIHPTWMED